MKDGIVAGAIAGVVGGLSGVLFGALGAQLGLYDIPPSITAEEWTIYWIVITRARRRRWLVGSKFNPQPNPRLK